MMEVQRWVHSDFASDSVEHCSCCEDADRSCSRATSSDCNAATLARCFWRRVCFLGANGKRLVYFPVLSSIPQCMFA
jgi:hypothetical protein